MATQSYIINEITNREIDTIRAANGTSKRASSGLVALYKLIQEKIAKAPTSRLYRLSNEIENLMKEEMARAAIIIQSDLVQLSAIEARFAEQLLVTATTIKSIDRTSASILKTFANSPITNFITGNEVTKPTVNDLIKKLGDTNARAVRNIIRDASLNGRTAQDISAEIQALVINKNVNDIDATTLTAFNHVSNQSKMGVYQSNADILDGMRIVATLDSRTSITCMGLDGKIIPLDSTQAPPFHYRCRSQLVPVVAKDLRLDIPGRERASEDGPVNANLTYDGFLRKQSKERQIEILGPGRAEIFRKGVSIKRFTNDSGVVLTIKQLQAKMPNEFN